MKLSWNKLTTICALLVFATLGSCVSSIDCLASSDELGATSKPTVPETTDRVTGASVTKESEKTPSEKHPAGNVPKVEAVELSGWHGQIRRLYEEYYSLVRRGNTAEAEVVLRRIISIEPNNGKHYSNLGALLSNNRKLPEAEIAYRQAVDLEPDNLIAQSGLGNTLGQRGKHAESEVVCKRAVKLIPKYVATHGNYNSLFASVYDNLGNSLYFQRKLAEAEKAFRKAVELDPNDPISTKNLANTLRDQGKHAEANMLYQRIR